SAPAAAPAASPAAAPAPAAPAAAAPAPAAGAKWYDTIKFGAFVDAYASFNWNTPHIDAGSNALHQYDVNNGFALSWVGLDATAAPEP
ncbi:hypothetical protein ABTJ52_21105, partial [Acinetobacter baumannii]